MKLTNKVLSDFDGNQIMAGEEPLTLANVLMNSAASAPDPKAETARTPEDVAKRHALAESLRKVGVGETFDLPLDVAMMLREDVTRIWVVVVAGQVIRLLDGSLE